MESLVWVQALGSFQNPGSMVGWNSGREEGFGETQEPWALPCLLPPGSCCSKVPETGCPAPGSPDRTQVTSGL